MTRRGWAQAHFDEAAAGWVVYDWSEHHDSGHIVSAHTTQVEADAAARKWAAENGRKYFAAVAQ